MFNGCGKSKGILIGHGTMGKRHKHHFETCGVRFKILDVEAWQWLKQHSHEATDFDFALITSPATTHYEYAKFFLQQKIPVFIEKPLATDFNQALELVQLAKKMDVTLFVAQSECFNPKFLNFRSRFKKKLTSQGWAHLTFCREHGFTHRCRDVDVALDILVHDLSLFLTLFNYDNLQVTHLRIGKTSENNPATLPVETSTDRVEMSIKVYKGTFAGVTADFIADRNSLNDQRTITVNYKDGSVETISLATYDSQGRLCHVADSLLNEHKFFLKLLKGSYKEWGQHLALLAAETVKFASIKNT